jgi:hypothetical protein
MEKASFSIKLAAAGQRRSLYETSFELPATKTRRHEEIINEFKLFFVPLWQTFVSFRPRSNWMPAASGGARVKLHPI